VPLPRNPTANQVREQDARLYRPLLDVYQRGALALRAQIAVDLAAGRFGTATMRQRQLARIQQILSELQDSAIPVAGQVVVDAYTQGGADVDSMLGSSNVAMEYGAVHRDAVTLLVENTTSRLNDLAVQVGRRIEDDYRRFGLHHATQQLVQQSTRVEASSDLAQTLVATGTASIDGDGTARFIDRSGRRWQIDRYAEMVIRTTTREAHTQGSLHRLADLAYPTVQVSSHVHDTDVCTPYDGQVYALDPAAVAPGRPLVGATPPFHPNCVHVLTPGPLVEVAPDSDLAQRERDAQAHAQAQREAEAAAAEAEAARQATEAARRAAANARRRARRVELRAQREAAAAQPVAPAGPQLVREAQVRRGWGRDDPFLGLPGDYMHQGGVVRTYALDGREVQVFVEHGWEETAGVELDFEAMARGAEATSLVGGAVADHTMQRLAALPADLRVDLERVNHLAGRNPQDPYWARRYNQPGFRSAATGGNGTVNSWSHSMSDGTLHHELGHVAGRTGQLTEDIPEAIPAGWRQPYTAGPPDADEWTVAAIDDADVARAGADRVTWERAGGELPRVSLPASLASDPYAITGYAANSLAEDWAESVRLWQLDRQRGRLAVRGYTNPEPVRFADLWPGRAGILDARFGGG
jgi:hypothetical protein